MITRFLWQGMGRNLRLFVLLVLAIGIVLPLLNLLMPPASALYVPAWALQLVGKYLCFASLALAVQRDPVSRPQHCQRPRICGRTRNFGHRNRLKYPLQRPCQCGDRAESVQEHGHGRVQQR